MTTSIAIRAVDIPMPKRLPNGTRTALEAAIELHHHALAGLIALLDLFDGDADLEPALGAHGGTYDAERNPPIYRDFSSRAGADREEECEDEGSEHDGREPDSDNEPSLGALLNHHHQTGWGNGNKEDLEDSLAHG